MTDPLSWNKAYEVGDKDIDAQHQWLFQVAQKIQDPEAGLAEEKEIIKELHHYTNIHFKKEEALMRKFSYPGLEAHQELHRKLIGNLEDLQQIDEYKRGGLVHLVELLMKWVRQHILEQDVQFIEYKRKLNP